MSYYTSSFSIVYEGTSTFEVKPSENKKQVKAAPGTASNEPKFIPNPDYGKTIMRTGSGMPIIPPSVIPNPKYVPKDDKERFLLEEVTKGNEELKRYTMDYKTAEKPVKAAKPSRKRKRYSLPKRFLECEGIRKYFVRMTGKSNAVFRVRGINLRPVTVKVDMSRRTITANFPLFPGRDVEVNSMGLFIDGLAVVNDGLKKQKDNLRVSYPVRRGGCKNPFYTNAVKKLCEGIAERL